MKKRNFNTIVKDINAYVTKNPERTTPDIYSQTPSKPDKMNEEEDYCPPEINLDELSSSQEQKLRQRGVIRKIVKKSSDKPAKDQRKWQHTRFNELVRRKERHERRRSYHEDSPPEKPTIRPTDDTYKLAFQSNDKIDQSGVWKLFSQDRVFIREIRIDGNQVVVKFTNEESGSRSADTLNSSKAGCSIKYEGPDGQPIKTEL